MFPARRRMSVCMVAMSLLLAGTMLGKVKKPAVPDSLKAKALNIPAGSNVTIKTTGGETLEGTLSGMTNEAVSLRSASGGKISNQTVAFSNIASMSKHGKVKPGKGVQTPEMLKAKLSSVAPGSPLTVTGPDKAQISGRFMGQSEKGIDLQVAEGSAMTTRTLPLDQVANVSVPKPNSKLKLGKPGMSGLQSPAMVKKSLSGIPVGSPVDLNMPGGASLGGKLTGMTDKGFSLQTLEGGNLVTKDIAFDQVAGVKPPKLGLKSKIPGLRPPSLQTPEALKVKALGLPAGSPVTLAMPDGQKIAGKLVGINNDGMQVQSVDGGNLVTRNLSFDQVGSIKSGLPTTRSAKVKKVGATVATIVVTAAVSGLIAGKLK